MIPPLHPYRRFVPTSDPDIARPETDGEVLARVVSVVPSGCLCGRCPLLHILVPPALIWLTPMVGES